MQLVPRLRAHGPRSRVLAACGLLLLTVSLGLALASPRIAQAAVSDPAFPRLGMWWPDNGTQSVADRARYDFIGLQNEAAADIPALRAANPDIRVLATTNARELNYGLTGSEWHRQLNSELNSASTDWMLTQAGSTLAAAVTGASASIPVADATRFRAGDMALVDHELLRVESVGAGALTVIRGEIDPISVTSHARGARIAAVCSVYPYSVEFDVSPGCPLADVGFGPETWRDWNVRRAQRVLASASWDGLTIDCHDPCPSWWVGNGYVRSVDEDRDNVPDDFSVLDPFWNTGMRAYGDALRAAVGPDVILLPNGDFRNFTLNGNVFQSFPAPTTTLTEWNRRAVGPYAAPWISYPEVMAGASGPNLSTLLTHGTRTDYRLMRFGLTTALLNDGYFMYAGSSLGASGLWWYDEYDNAGAGRGYLGHPTAPAVKTGGAWRRDYTGGVVLVNPTPSPVTVQLGGTFRKIRGSQDPKVNTGAAVGSVTLAARDGVIVLRLPTAVLHASRTTLAWGQETTLQASVSPAPGLAVRFQQRAAGTSRWLWAATRATDAEGGARVVRVPLVTTEYRAVSVSTGAVSKTVRVGVRPRVTLKASRTNVVKPTHVALSGTVAHPGHVAVALQRLVEGRWTTVRRLVTTTSGKYSATVGFSRRGTFSYRVHVAADTSRLAVTSSTVRIVVR